MRVSRAAKAALADGATDDDADKSTAVRIVDKTGVTSAARATEPRPEIKTLGDKNMTGGAQGKTNHAARKWKNSTRWHLCQRSVFFVPAGQYPGRTAKMGLPG